MQRYRQTIVKRCSKGQKKMYSLIQGEIYEQTFLIKRTSNEVIYNCCNSRASLLVGNYKNQGLRLFLQLQTSFHRINEQTS